MEFSGFIANLIISWRLTPGDPAQYTPPLNNIPTHPLHPLGLLVVCRQIIKLNMRDSINIGKIFNRVSDADRISWCSYLFV